MAGPERLPVIILAGGTAKADLAAATGVTNRALLPVGGETMLARVARAVGAAETVDRVVVAGNVPPDPTYEAIDDAGSFVGNIFSGLAAAGTVAHVVICTSDIPFLTPGAVDDFVRRGLALNADMAYPIVEVARCYERYPGLRRTALRLRDGTYTGGNMVLVRPAFMDAHRDRIAEAYAARKSPLRLAAMLGWGTTLRLMGVMAGLRGLLGVQDLEAAAGRMLGGVLRAVVSEHAEIATDIDRPSDLAALRDLGL